MVRAVRQGMPMRRVARRFRVSLSVVQRWVRRAEGQRLDRVDWEGLSRRPHVTMRTTPHLEELVLEVRQQLRDHSVLGEYGATAICDALRSDHGVGLSRSTIARILRRRGAVEKRSRVRRKAPPKGWYLPAVRDRCAELDSSDFIEGLAIRGGLRVAVLTVTALHGGLCGAFPQARRSARGARSGLLVHWHRHGLPQFAQFDNDTVFQGPHQFRDIVGRVTRTCLALGITPVFAPPREHGPQNAIEGFNGLWQSKLWHRREWTSLEHLQQGSDVYVDALLRRRAARIQSAPPRDAFPDDWVPDADLHGHIVYLRRADESGRISLLGHVFDVSPVWSHRLVRADVDLDLDEIRIHGLSPRSPNDQPHIATVSHHVPRKPLKR